MNNLTIYNSVSGKTFERGSGIASSESDSVEGPALSGSDIGREKSGETSQLILPVLENVHQEFRNLCSDPTLTHIILQYIIFLQCYRESYRLLYAYKTRNRTLALNHATFQHSVVIFAELLCVFRE